jgi:hypothetical protein
VTEHRAEIARRIQAARFPCHGRRQPCQTCGSRVFQGCVYIAESVLTPLEPPALEYDQPERGI